MIIDIEIKEEKRRNSFLDKKLCIDENQNIKRCDRYVMKRKDTWLDKKNILKKLFIRNMISIFSVYMI
jgi:hypothetical protein